MTATLTSHYNLNTLHLFQLGYSPNTPNLIKNYYHDLALTRITATVWAMVACTALIWGYFNKNHFSLACGVVSLQCANEFAYLGTYLINVQTLYELHPRTDIPENYKRSISLNHLETSFLPIHEYSLIYRLFRTRLENHRLVLDALYNVENRHVL